MPIPRYELDEQARLDFTIDWTTWMVSGDTIVSSTWASSGAPLVVENPSNTTLTTLIWARFSGAIVVGRVYSAINHITTAMGRQEDQTLEFIAARH